MKPTASGSLGLRLRADPLRRPAEPGFHSLMPPGLPTPPRGRPPLGRGHTPGPVPPEQPAEAGWVFPPELSPASLPEAPLPRPARRRSGAVPPAASCLVVPPLLPGPSAARSPPSRTLVGAFPRPHLPAGRVLTAAAKLMPTKTLPSACPCDRPTERPRKSRQPARTPRLREALNLTPPLGPRRPGPGISFLL